MITKYTSEAALDFHTGKDEVHHAQLANLAAMARSIFHQVGATESLTRSLRPWSASTAPTVAFPMAA